MDEELLRRIRERAHWLWEQEGRPEGRADEHWKRALAELAADEREALRQSRDEIIPQAEHVGPGEQPVRERIRKQADRS
jgi:hypothetical protein